MLKQQILEGAQAIALTVNNIQPGVVAAYPITPQTHIVETLAQLKADGLADFQYVKAESEYAAASIVLGATATGVRSYTATSSQGLLYMLEVLYNIAGLRLPVVLTCANRAVSAPLNIWNDQQDAMAMRDAGWLMFFAANHQEAVDQHIMAYALAEKLRLPVVVNVDGFILTHSFEPVAIPSAFIIKKYLPDYKPQPQTYLNTQQPITLGHLVTPEHYQTYRQNLHQDLINSLSLIKTEYRKYQKIIHGQSITSQDNGLYKYYGPARPQTIIVAMGSVAGTIQQAIDEGQQKKVGLLQLKVYRPFPIKEILGIIKLGKNVAVIEKAISLGSGGPLATDLQAIIPKAINFSSYIAGLGGRDITVKMIQKIIKQADQPQKITKFL